LSYGPFNAFSDIPYSFWASDTSLYEVGYYIGTNSIGGYSGEWLKIQLPYAFTLTSYAIQSDYNYARSIIDQYILGSNDDMTWTLLDMVLDRSPEVDLVTFTPSAPVTTAYSYYAVVIGRIREDGDLASVIRFELYGNYSSV
jgi:hypothetical protein